MTVPSVLLESFVPGEFGRSFRFDGFRGEVVARTPDRVLPALEELEEGVARGLHAAGFIAYEAARSLEPVLPAGHPSPHPLLWFGLFAERHVVAAGAAESGFPFATSEWHASLDREGHRRGIARIRELIAAGETYQVNYTFKRRFRLEGDPFAWYRRICRSQQAPFCAFIDTGDLLLLSASPELFFALREEQLTARPMKGTAPRGRFPAEDRELAEALRRSAKERAENLMIVDLLRNDLGVVAETGSVRVDSLFDVESYPTVHQMTSTVKARLRPGTGFAELLRALFPCGSVTGAPKRRTMEIIAGLEKEGRGIYTGAIGYLSPGREAVFSVAIRTAVIDKETGCGELGVGSGVTWDSDPTGEYDECFAKSRFAEEPLPPFALIESLLWEEPVGYFLLDRHLARLRCSAARFGFPLDEAEISRCLVDAARGATGGRKVRLLVASAGGVTVESLPVGADLPGAVLVAGIASEPIDSRDLFLYHKTDRRARFDRERALHPTWDEVLFVNERGEVTEGSYHNVVVRIAGELVTPPVSSGLLPGVFREELLERGEIRERVIGREELARAEELWLINSVRRWRRARLA